MEASKAMPAVTYIRAQQRRTEYRRRFLESMENVDVVAAPTLPVTAPEIESREVQTGRSPEDVRLALLRLTRPGNLTGFPAITVPCGFSADGLPIGLQILGRPLDEATVLRVAHSYEAATRWHERFPSETGASVPEPSDVEV
jgi:aspartyl-tRNA(Asn)/glutamyl-tRNA(Gln) amidotransferase subunit A